MLYWWIYTSNERYTIFMCLYEATTGESIIITDGAVDVVESRSHRRFLNSGLYNNSQLLPASSNYISNVSSISSVLNLVIDRIGSF